MFNLESVKNVSKFWAAFDPPVVANRLELAIAEIERLRAAERNYQAAHDLQDDKIGRLRAAIKNIIEAIHDGDDIAAEAYAKTALASEQKEDSPPIVKPDMCPEGCGVDRSLPHRCHYCATRAPNANNIHCYPMFRPQS